MTQTMATVFCIVILLLTNCRGETEMQSIETINRIISFDDSHYFKLTDKDVEELSWEKVSEYDFDGITIAAPGMIDISEHDIFPVLQASGYDGGRNALLKEGRNIIALVYGKAGMLFIGPPKYESKMIDYTRLDTNPSEIPPEINNTRFSGCKKFDLRKSLDISWEPASYRVTFVYYDWLSNTISTELYRDNAKPENKPLPIPAAFDAEVAVKPLVKDAPNTMRFSIPERVHIGDKKIPLTISINLPVIAECKKMEKTMIAWRSLSFLLVRKNQDQRPVLRYDINIAGSIERKTEPLLSVLEGTFEIDLMSVVPSFFSDEIEYCCYLVSYEMIAGPEIIEVVKK